MNFILVEADYLHWIIYYLDIKMRNLLQEKVLN